MRTAKRDGLDLPNGFRLYRQLNRSRGWQAQFRIFGVVHSKYFSDAEYGSPSAAREAAERFASQNRELHEELIALRRRFDIRANSRSGIPGVARYGSQQARGPFWLAYWDDEHGRRKTRRFSVRRLGETTAFEMAIKARDDGVELFRLRYQEILDSLDRS